MAEEPGIVKPISRQRESANRPGGCRAVDGSAALKSVWQEAGGSWSTAYEVTAGPKGGQGRGSDQCGVGTVTGARGGEASQEDEVEQLAGL